jgi:hypothetical protein
VAAEFGDIEEPATVVGEEPGEQHLVMVVGADRIGDLLPQRLAGNESGSVGEFGWAVSVAEQAG